MIAFTVVKTHINPGHLIPVRIRLLLSHIDVFSALFLLLVCNHLCPFHVFLQDHHSTLLNDVCSLVLCEDLLFRKNFGRKFSLKCTFAALFKLQGIGGAYLDVSLHKLDVLSAWIVSQVLNQPGL